VAYDWIIEALAETWDGVTRVLRGRDERSFDALTACPGWSVRDVLNHLTGVGDMGQGSIPPERTDVDPPHVRNPLGSLNEAFVASRRHLTGQEAVEEFRRMADWSLRRLRSLTLEEWEAVVWSPEGHRTEIQVQERRVIDSWIHLQDLRDALLEPDDDHGVGEEIVLNYFEGAMPYLWAKRASAPEGAQLRIALNGRSARTFEVAVVGGRGVAVPVTDEPVTVSLLTAPALFWRRCAGRINAEAFLRASATDVRGDRRLVERLAQEMVVIP
jgi:uncharacterized protein (TIGR03083 family)